MQAIQTKYLAPSDKRAARIRAVCAAGSVVVAYDDELGPENNHRAAAEALAVKLGWTIERGHQPLESGGLKDGSWVHVFSESAKAVLMVRIAMREGSMAGNPWGKPWGKAVGALTDADQGGSAYLAGYVEQMTARLAKQG